LKPTGAAVVTLHGELYARLFLSSERQQEFADSGYVEVAGAEPGANAFSTFHSRLVAENLFCKFRSVRFFPRGNEQRPPHLFPFAALQDIYILRP